MARIVCPPVACDLATDEVHRLDSGGAFVDRGDPRIAQVLRSAGLDVALALGFAEPSAFHRAFKKWTGANPGEYRQSSQRRPEARADLAG